ncbi:MAG TPA: hypothetical protein VMR41_02060 [Patescibacteria group bacterium]|nr:hypothetical protein [Patescibacteria group bacterium]
MFAFLKNLLIIVFLLGLVVFATFYSDSIKSFVFKQLQSSGAKVLGASTNGIPNSSLSKEVNKEVNSTAVSVRNQVMQIKIGDIVNSFSQTQKIVHDVSGLQSTVRAELQKLSK